MSQDLTTIFTLRAPDNQISTIAIDYFTEIDKLTPETRAEYLKTVKDGLVTLFKKHPEFKSYKVAHVNNNNLLRIPGVKRFPTFSEFLQMLDLGDTTFDTVMILTQPYEKALELIFAVPGYNAFPTDRFIRVDLFEDSVFNEDDTTEVIEDSSDESLENEETPESPEENSDNDTEESTTEDSEEATLAPEELPIWYKAYKSRTINEGTIADLSTEALNQATILAVGPTVLTRKITTEQFRVAYEQLSSVNIDLSQNGFTILPASRNYLNQIPNQIDAWVKAAEPLQALTGHEFNVNINRRPSYAITLTGDGQGLKLYIN